MDWVMFALLAPALWAMNNVLSKILVDKKFDKPFPFTIFLVFIDIIFASAVFIFTPVSFLFPYFIYAIFTGLMTMFAFWFFCKAIMMEEISRISSLNQIIPIFVAILSAVFLNEILILQQYMGIVLIVVASMLISYKKTKNGKKMSPALKFILVFAISISLYTILAKYILNHINYWSLFFWNWVGTAIAVPILLSSRNIRKDFIKVVSIMDKRTLAVGILNECFFFFGYLATLIAMSLGPVSLVSSIGAIQPLFVLVYTTVLSLFIPRILKEEISRFNIAQKLFAILLIFIGMWMINVF